MPAVGELRCVDAAIESVLEDIDSAFILKEEHRTSSLHGFVPVTPEAEAPRCAKAASRCFSHRVGVYLDHSAGVLSFYSVSDTMTLLHRVQTTFTQPLYAGVWVYCYPGDTAEFCKLK
ncbi:unnamed protein product [Pleuronectes platessa]|uniref:B30.2/SPRY domain-containing protein n=1 Tax=Pleuronectes platessa TaxID=8262 RepID=A0A9N7TJW4_PLEPL|nr:unnamed protein product [Pleuronectes platessa]